MSYPANKLSIDDVKSIFLSYGCTLITDVYRDNKSPLDFVCSCGELGKKSLSKFKDNPKCKRCGYKSTGAKNSKYGLDDIKTQLEKLGITLLSTSYMNNSTHLDVMCNLCGSVYKTTLANAKNHTSCVNCSNKTKWSYASVKQEFEKRGCTLLSPRYNNCNDQLDYICSCGQKSEVTFANFHYKKSNCKTCGIKKISGANSVYYNPSISDDERITKRHTPENKSWIKAVFERDGYTCDICGIRGSTLNAHHLNDYANHKDSRFDIDNGITLCSKCHSKFHSMYGLRTKTTKQQYIEFKNKEQSCLVN